VNPARPGPGTVLAREQELAVGQAKCLHFEGGEARFSLILIRLETGVAAYENSCPHARFPLEKLNGEVIVQEGRYVVCAAHGASFRAKDGAFVAGPGDGRGLQPFPIAVEDGLIIVGQPPPP
jgi:nitrite reductase/ring-hydroxylating ferredoxin subunit